MERCVFQDNAVHWLDANPIGVISAITVFDAVPKTLDPSGQVSLIGIRAAHPREAGGRLGAQDCLKPINAHFLHSLTFAAIDPEDSVQAFQAADLAVNLSV